MGTARWLITFDVFMGAALILLHGPAVCIAAALACYGLRLVRLVAAKRLAWILVGGLRCS